LSRRNIALTVSLVALCLATVRADQITLATLNVHNFFDAHNDPYRQDEGTPEKSAESQAALAAAIKELDADLLALQEVESREVLEQFNRTRLGGLYAHVVCIEGNDGRGIDVALLSKLPVVFAATYQHRHWPAAGGLPHATSFARDVLRVRVRATDQTTLELLVLHLKSKSGGESSDPWRSREVEGVRAIVREIIGQQPELPLAMLGDFNDLPDAPPLSALFDPNAQPRLLDLTRGVPLADRWSFVYEGERQQLDYLLATQPLQSRLMPGSVRFHRLPSGATDHSAVSATFDLPGTTERQTPGPPPWAGLTAPGPPDLATAIPATVTERLRARLGTWTVVTGTVRQVFWSPTGKVCYVNFAARAGQALSGVVFQSAFDTFPELRDLTGKSVAIQGVVAEYEGNLQIVLVERGQLAAVHPGQLD
jgi:endonuclease/exonuclease/phosphatase family metal-dependent hydrolase